MRRRTTDARYPSIADQLILRKLRIYAKIEELLKMEYAIVRIESLGTKERITANKGSVEKMVDVDVLM